MAKLYNIARMTTATTGTGTVTLGSAVSGHLSFANAGISNGDVVSYTIFEGSARETGRGTFTSPDQFARTTVLNSTAGGTTKITLAGAAEVMITALKEDIANLNEANTFTADQTVQSADAGASAGPNVILDRNSASPAASDVLGSVAFKGRDSGGGTDTYAQVQAEITDATATSEDGILNWLTAVAGTLATRFKVGAGLFYGAGTDKGDGTVNSKGNYLNGNRMSDWTVIRKTGDTTRNTNTTTSADPDLQFSLAASTIYDIRIIVKFRSTAAGDLKWGLAGPASPTEVYGGYSMDNSGAITKGFEAYPTNIAQLQGGDGARFLQIEMTVENGANAGTFGFDWAQNTSDAGPTTVKAGSYIEYFAR